MPFGSFLNPTQESRFAIPAGSRIDPVAEQRELMRRHMIVGDYTMPLFLRDLYKEGERRVITAETLELHLQCLRTGESKLSGSPLSAERIKEMILDVDHGEDNLAKIDAQVLEALGLKTVTV